MRELTVGLGERAYPILIDEGLMTKIGPDLARRGVAKRYAIVADSRVTELYGRRLQDSLAGNGLEAELLAFPQGEESKNLGTIADLASKLARLGFDRRDGLVALGGGVTGDITGFLAAVYMRGIPFVQIPTTLLAQVDSSVGGKTGVDIPEGKNLVGAFYQPRAVFIDSGVLMELPAAELLNGLAEVIKYGVIADKELFAFLEVHRQAVLDRDPDTLAEMIATCCAIKARVVEADEREADYRRVLNFGHTIGHAVEAASGYVLAHGQAVAVGMVAAAEIAVSQQRFDRVEADRLRDLIASYGLPTAIPEELDRSVIKGYLKTDKKTVGGRPVFILPLSIGEVIITDEVDEEALNTVLSP